MATKQPKLTRALRGQVRRATNRINTVEARDFPSGSDPSKVYHAVVYLNGMVLCDCMGWTIKKPGRPRSCKHTIALIGERPTHTDGEFVYITRG